MNKFTYYVIEKDTFSRSNWVEISNSFYSYDMAFTYLNNLKKNNNLKNTIYRIKEVSYYTD